MINDKSFKINVKSGRMKKIIISIGNPLKSDDNVANLVLDELKKRPINAYFIKAKISPENFLGLIKTLEPERIYFIDAMEFPGNIGEVKTFRLEDVSEFQASTHNIPITLFKQFLPDSEIILIGIKPKDLSYGQELTPELKSQFERIVEKIERMITS